MGLLSDGGLHSHNSHLFALFELARRHEFNDVYIHCFLDGRDVSPISGIEFIKAFIERTHSIGGGSVEIVM